MTFLYILITLEKVLFKQIELDSYKQIRLFNNFYKKGVSKKISLRLK